MNNDFLTPLEGESEVSEQGHESQNEQAKWAWQTKALWSEWVEWVEWAVRANKHSERPSGLFKTRLILTRNTPQKTNVGWVWLLTGQEEMSTKSWKVALKGSSWANQNPKYPLNHPIYFFLNGIGFYVSCTPLYRLICRSVGPSIGHIFKFWTFLGYFKVM